MEIFAWVLPSGKEFVFVNISGLEKNSGISSLTSDVEVLQDRQHAPTSASSFSEW